MRGVLISPTKWNPSTQWADDGLTAMNLDNWRLASEGEVEAIAKDDCTDISGVEQVGEETNKSKQMLILRCTGDLLLRVLDLGTVFKRT